MTAGRGPALLDSYEIERRPVGQRNVGHADVSHANDREQQPGPAIADDTPEGARARQALADAIVPAQTRKVITDGLALGYRYDPSPIVWPDGTPGSRGHRHRLSPDRPARQPRAACLHRARALDHRPVRQGFCADAVRFGRRVADRARLRATRRAASRGDDREPRTCAALYQRTLVLVRPDGHVAWRADAPPADRAATACAAHLA